MYHEERVIDGVLNYRTSPNGDWTPYTASELTYKLLNRQYYISDKNHA